MKTNIPSATAPLTRAFFVLLPGLALILFACNAEAQTIDNYGVYKWQTYLQNSTATPTHAIIVGDPDGDYNFQASVSGSNLNLLTPDPSVTLPNASVVTLIYEPDENKWSYSGTMPAQHNFTSKAELDAAFPDGIYTMNISGTSVPLKLSPDSYPVVPKLTTGVWDSAGGLMVSASANYTFNFNTFTGYAHGGFVQLHIYDIGNDGNGQYEGNGVFSTFLLSSNGDPLTTTVNLPANTLQSGTTYYAELTFGQFTTLDKISIPATIGGVAIFESHTGFYINTGGPPTGMGVLVAAKGDQLDSHPGNAVLSVSGSPAVDAAGDVAVHVIITGSNKNSTNNSGILLYSGSTFTVVAHLGSDDGGDPVTGVPYTKLSDPVLSGSGALAYIGTLKTGSNGVTSANNSAVYVFQSGTLGIVAQKGQQPVLTGSNFAVPVAFSTFTQIAVNNAGGISFLGDLAGTGVNVPAFFSTDAGGNLDCLLYKGKAPHVQDLNVAGFTGFVPLSLVGGQSRTIDTVNGNVSVLLADLVNKVAFALSGSDGFQYGSASLGSTEAEIGNSTPDGDFFKTFNEPIVNANGSVAFLSTVTGNGITAANNAEIWLVTGGSNATKVAQTGALAADAAGNTNVERFAQLSDPVLNNNDRIAFVATLKTGGTSGVIAADDTGIWSDADGTGKRVAREGDPAPGSIGKFSKFNQIVLPDVGGVVFQATLSGVPSTHNQGVWAVTAQGLLPVVITGQQLPFRNNTTKTVKTIGIFQQAAFALGQSRSFDASTANLVYEATFTDGTWGIYEVTFP